MLQISVSSRTLTDFEDKRRHFKLNCASIRKINPNTLTVPVFRTEKDADLTARIYARIPVLIDETKGSPGNLWGMSFLTIFHMSNDSNLFRTAEQLASAGFVCEGTDWIAPKGIVSRQPAFDLVGGRDLHSLDLQGGRPTKLDRYVPLYEAKMIHQFDNRWATYDNAESRDVTADEKIDPDFESFPRYWVPAHEVETRLMAKNWKHEWLIGWRDITNATNERTVISSVIPKTAAGHKFPLFFVNENDPRKNASLFANLNSITLDSVARQKLGGTSLTYFILKQFPILPPFFYDNPALAFIVPRVLELTYTSRSMAPFARDLGYDGPPFAWNEDRRALLRGELDAWYARAYGLTRDELRYILDPADVMGPEYPSETFRGLKNNEVRKYGEYRTARLVLDAWDRLERGELADTPPPIVVASAPKPRPLVARIDPAMQPDNAWVRPRIDPHAETGLFLAAMLKALDGPTSIRDVRMASVLGLEARVLGKVADAQKSAEWRRLVGAEAAPLPNAVSQLSSRNSGWGEAVTHLRGNGYLIENLDAGTWAPGEGLDTFATAGWADGRAAFVLDIVRNLSFDEAIESLPVELKDWVNAA